MSDRPGDAAGPPPTAGPPPEAWPTDAGGMFVERAAFDAWLAAIIEERFDAAEEPGRIEDGRQGDMFDAG